MHMALISEVINHHEKKKALSRAATSRPESSYVPEDESSPISPILESMAMARTPLYSMVSGKGAVRESAAELNSIDRSSSDDLRRERGGI